MLHKTRLTLIKGSLIMFDYVNVKPTAVSSIETTWSKKEWLGFSTFLLVFAVGTCAALVLGLR